MFALANHSILILALALADTHTAKKNQIFSFLLKKKKKKTLLRHKSSHRHTEAITMKVCEPTTTTTIWYHPVISMNIMIWIIRTDWGDRKELLGIFWISEKISMLGMKIFSYVLFLFIFGRASKSFIKRREW